VNWEKETAYTEEPCVLPNDGMFMVELEGIGEDQFDVHCKLARGEVLFASDMFLCGELVMT
jgi:hypothetical protein